MLVLGLVDQDAELSLDGRVIARLSLFSDSQGRLKLGIEAPRAVQVRRVARRSPFRHGATLARTGRGLTAGSPQVPSAKCQVPSCAKCQLPSSERSPRCHRSS